MRKSKKIIKLIVVMVLAINLFTLYGTTTLAVNSVTSEYVKELVESAKTTLAFVDYNIAYGTIMQLTPQEQSELLPQLATISEKVYTKDITTIIDKMNVLSNNKDLKNYNELMSLIEKEVKLERNRQYLLGELNAWGFKMVFTPDVVAATNAINQAWEKKNDDSIALAFINIQKVKNAGSLEWLTEHYNQVNAASATEKALKSDSQKDKDIASKLIEKITDVNAKSYWKTKLTPLSEIDNIINDYTKRMELKPNEVSNYVARGNAYFDNKEYDKALADYNKEIEISSKYYLSYNRRGNSYFYLKDYDNAIADYTKAISIYSDNGTVYYNRGNAYFNKKDYDQAITDYTYTLELKSLKGQVMYIGNIAGCNYSVKDGDNSIAKYDKGSYNSRYDLYYNSRGNAYYIKGDYDKAIADYNKAIETSSTFSWAYSNRGHAYYSLGIKDKAIEDFKKALSLNLDIQSARVALKLLKVEGY